MSNNKKAKQRLIELYGEECFIDKLKLRYEPKKQYTGKSQMERMKQLTYHHIKMKKDGGHATVENGALLSAENHAWFHQQSPQLQGYMNAIFQEYKHQSDECKIKLIDHLSLDFEIKPTTLTVNEKGQILEQKKEKYNRAKEKREFQKRIDDEWER